MRRLPGHCGGGWLLVAITDWPGPLQLVPGTKAGPGGPAGFATLKTLLITPELKAAGINVFGRPSGKVSIVLKVKVQFFWMHGNVIVCLLISVSVMAC